MLYTAYEWSRRVGAPVTAASQLAARTLKRVPAPMARTPAVRHMRAACELLGHARATHVRPLFGIESVPVDDEPAAVRERVLMRTPFASLLHFEKPSVRGQPRVLVVGPMVGHFATLVRPTIQTLLSDHDVHVIDWHNARDIPVEHGAFGLDEYIEHVMDAIRHLGPHTHVIAVGQPAVPVLAAAALLAEADDPAQPPSVTLIAGPIDTRVNPNRVDARATARPLSWFDRRVVTRVPRAYAGAGRRVCPGIVHLTAFMSMNPRRHLSAQTQLYRDLVAGYVDRAADTRAFYDEYYAVMDVPAEFYLDTVRRVFQEHHLPTGRLTWRGQRVDPGAIRRTALLTVEGENDDLCSPGQTAAAHELCTGIPPERKHHHLQPGVGHYGVFSGSRWEVEIYPVVREFIDRAQERLASSA